jgi:hypothetical protein
MLEEIIEHQNNVFLQNCLVGKNSLKAFVKVMGKCWNSGCGMVVLMNVASFAFFVYSVPCMQISDSSILGSILFYQTIEITGSKNKSGTA